MRRTSSSLILSAAGHRPWEIPQRSWVMSQEWHDLAFLHWPIDPAQLARFVRPPLTLDTFDGRAWIGLIPFRLGRIHLRGLPPLPGLSGFAELNVRTYVRYRGRPGVLFLSLDANHCVLATIARYWFRLPYHLAHVDLEKTTDGWIRFSARRSMCEAMPAGLRVDYRPSSDVSLASRGTLEHWLTERYCLYTFDRRDRLICAEIHHEPWPLQKAEAVIEQNTMMLNFGIDADKTPPVAHFSQAIKALIWTPQSASAAALTASSSAPPLRHHKESTRTQDD